MENPHRFKVGDRVVIVRAPTAEMIGAVREILDLVPLGARTSLTWPAYMHGVAAADLGPSVRHGARVQYPLTHLEPYRPDHNERADPTAMPEWIRRLTKQRERA